MEILERKTQAKSDTLRFTNTEIILVIIALAALVVMIITVFSPNANVIIMVLTGSIITICVAFLIRLFMNPDSVRARQTDSMLQLSSSMVELMKDGMTPQAAQEICELLLPTTASAAVAITDTENILGYAGYKESENLPGTPIRTIATREVIADGRARAIYSLAQIGFPNVASPMKAAIIVPLVVGRETRGVLKFYYRNSSKISETQKSIAQGFGELLATEIAAAEMETQRELATSMELKMLQSQINPHFLFNTINTIASLIRTDPENARTLLREFATFYRSTLEDSQDRIKLTRELEHAERYFLFELARFGENRLSMVKILPENVRPDDIMVPPFLLQPLIENAVLHAMPAEGKLTITLRAQVQGSSLLIDVEDDGIGMDEKTCQSIMHPESQSGLGIAIKNVHDRLHGYFGKDAKMLVESTLGVGTKITLVFPDVYPETDKVCDITNPDR